MLPCVALPHALGQARDVWLRDMPHVAGQKPRSLRPMSDGRTPKQCQMVQTHAEGFMYTSATG